MSKEEITLEINHITEFLSEQGIPAYEARFADERRKELQEQLDILLAEEKIAEELLILKAQRQADGDRMLNVLHEEQLLREQHALAERKALAIKRRKRIIISPDIRTLNDFK